MRFCRRGEPTICPSHRIIGEHIDGGLADYTVVPAANLLRKPARLTFVEAAAVPVVFMTAWHMLFTVGKLQMGERVLIPGAGGGVASAGIQLAHHAGAVVYTTTSTDEKAQMARLLGAELCSTIERTTGSAPFWMPQPGEASTWFRTTWGANWADALRTLARNGRLVSCGSHSGAAVEFDIGQVYHRQLRILGSNGGTYQDLAAALAVIEAGHARPIIHAVLPLEELREGHRLLETHDHFGKIVIEM